MLDTLQQVIALIVALGGLIGTGVSAFFMIKALIAKNKNKTAAEIWELLMTVADSAMKAAEESGKKGADKKQMVIDVVKASALSSGIDIGPFVDQLSAYIDQTISFVNSLNKPGAK